MRLAFGTIRGLPDPSAAFGDSDAVRTRFRAAPECAWVAEVDGDVVGSVFAARWGSFGLRGLLTVEPRLWDHGIGGLLLRPVLEAFERWEVRQAGLHVRGEPQAPRPVPETRLLARSLDGRGRQGDRPASAEPARGLLAESSGIGVVLAEVRGLTDEVFEGSTSVERSSLRTSRGSATRSSCGARGPWKASPCATAARGAKRAAVPAT